MVCLLVCFLVGLLVGYYSSIMLAGYVVAVVYCLMVILIVLM